MIDTFCHDDRGVVLVCLVLDGNRKVGRVRDDDVSRPHGFGRSHLHDLTSSTGHCAFQFGRGFGVFVLLFDFLFGHFELLENLLALEHVVNGRKGKPRDSDAEADGSGNFTDDAKGCGGGERPDHSKALPVGEQRCPDQEREEEELDDSFESVEERRLAEEPLEAVHGVQLLEAGLHGFRRKGEADLGDVSSNADDHGNAHQSCEGRQNWEKC